MSVSNVNNNSTVVNSTETTAPKTTNVSNVAATNQLASSLLADSRGASDALFNMALGLGASPNEAIGNLFPTGPEQTTGSLKAPQFTAQNQRPDIFTINPEGKQKQAQIIDTASVFTTGIPTTQINPQTGIDTVKQQPILVATTIQQQPKTEVLPTKFDINLTAANTSQISDTGLRADKLVMPLSLSDTGKEAVLTSSANNRQVSGEQASVKEASTKDQVKIDSQARSIKDGASIKRDAQITEAPKGQVKESVLSIKQDAADVRAAQNALVEQKIKEKSNKDVEYRGAVPINNQRENQQQQNQGNQEENQERRDNDETYEAITSISDNRLASLPSGLAQEVTSLLSKDGVNSLLSKTKVAVDPLVTELSTDLTDPNARATILKAVQEISKFKDELDNLVPGASNLLAKVSNSLLSGSGRSNLVSGGNTLFAGSMTLLPEVNLLFGGASVIPSFGSGGLFALTEDQIRKALPTKPTPPPAGADEATRLKFAADQADFQFAVNSIASAIAAFARLADALLGLQADLVKTMTQTLSKA